MNGSSGNQPDVNGRPGETAAEALLPIATSTATIARTRRRPPMPSGFAMAARCPSACNVSTVHGIVTDMRGSNAQDFHDFVVAGSPALTKLARLLTDNVHSGEDLLQATLLRAWSAWPRVRRADNPDAYVRRVMINLATKGRRRRWRSEIPAATLPEIPGRDDHAAIDSRDELVQGLRQLPPRQRAAVVLRYFADLDDAAIADTMDCSVATVRSQISRALASLRVVSAHDATPAEERS